MVQQRGASRSPINAGPTQTAACKAAECSPIQSVKISASMPPSVAASAPMVDRTRSVNMSKAKRAPFVSLGGGDLDLRQTAARLLNIPENLIAIRPG